MFIGKHGWHLGLDARVAQVSLVTFLWSSQSLEMFIGIFCDWVQVKEPSFLTLRTWLLSYCGSEAEDGAASLGAVSAGQGLLAAEGPF